MATEESRSEEKKSNDYGPCQEINILLMGRTRTGKSTIVEVLKTPLYRPEQPLTLYSQTRETAAKKFFTTDKTDGKSYRFTIADTPGFFDTNHHDQQRLENKQIALEIRNCMNFNIRNVHLVGVVFNLINGINDRDIETMIYIKKMFPGIEKNTALIVTNCEQFDENRRQRFTDQFFQHPQVIKNRLKEFFGQGILYMGSLRYESFQEVNANAIYFQYKNVLQMRHLFIKKCIESSEKVTLNESSCSIM